MLGLPVGKKRPRIHSSMGFRHELKWLLAWPSLNSSIPFDNITRLFLEATANAKAMPHACSWMDERGWRNYLLPLCRP